MDPRILLSAVGFILSAYSYLVKKRLSDPSYTPLCHLGDHVSCKKAFESSFSELFLLPNMLWGMLFYSCFGLLVHLGLVQLTLILSGFAVLGSLYLAYVSYFVQKNVCIICTSVYLVNVLLLLYSL